MTVILEEVRREFWDAWNGLRDVHTQEELEDQSKKMWAARKRLMKIDPEFRAMIKDREDKAKEDVDAHRVQIEAKHKSIVSEAEVAAAMTKARAVMRIPDGDLEDWIQEHRFKSVAPEEANMKSKLVCPICHGHDRGNLINGKPTCFPCMHILVPESDLKNYNRNYRRRWRKNRTRKGKAQRKVG